MFLDYCYCLEVEDKAEHTKKQWHSPAVTAFNVFVANCSFNDSTIRDSCWPGNIIMTAYILEKWMLKLKYTWPPKMFFTAHSYIQSSLFQALKLGIRFEIFFALVHSVRSGLCVQSGLFGPQTVRGSVRDPVHSTIMSTYVSRCT